MKKEDLTETTEDKCSNQNVNEKELSLFGTDDKAPMSIRKRLALGVLAAVLMCALGLALPALIEAVDPAAEAELASESDASAAADAPAAHTNKSGMLAITAYAAEWKETILQPGISIALNKYSALQSDVPGLPFVVSVPEGSADINADGIRIDVDAGTIITWEPPDYTVRERGLTYIISGGDTIYWSPLDAQGAALPRCEMTITAYNGKDEAYTQKIIISQTEDFSYTAELQ